MTALDALHAAILADPADDLPRLAYADWLEEHGDAEQQVSARFIRVQLRLAALGDRCIGAMCNCERCHLRYEEGGILGELTTEGYVERFTAWTADLRRILGMRVSEATPDLAVPPEGYAAARFRRGFVADLVCHPSQWLAFHAELLRLYPLERVALYVTPLTLVRHLLARTEWLTGGRLSVRLREQPHDREVVVSGENLETHNYAVCVEHAVQKLCEQTWPGIQLIYAREDQ